MAFIGRRFWVGVLLALAVAPALGAGEAEESYARGVKALEAKRADEAIAALEHARGLDPRRAEVAYQLARAYELDGTRVEDAVALYAEAARLDPQGAGPAAKADAARLRARWLASEVESATDYRKRRLFRQAREQLQKAFEIANGVDAEAARRSRSEYVQVGAEEVAQGALANRPKGASVCVVPAEVPEPESPFADLQAAALDALQGALKAGGARVLPPAAREEASVVVTATIGARLTLQASEKGGGEVLAQVALRALGSEEGGAPRDPATQTPATAAADLARRLAEGIAEKAQGAKVRIATPRLEGDRARAGQLSDLLVQLLGIELDARARGRFALLPAGGDRQAGVVIEGTVLAGDPLATVRLEARRAEAAGEKAIAVASATFACPMTEYGKPLKLEVTVRAEKQVQPGRWAELPVRPEMDLSSGDQVQIHFQVSRDCYVYVLLYSSGTNEAVRVFPDASRISVSNHAKGGRLVKLPSDDLWFVLDEHTGTESLYVFAADEPLDDLDRLLDRVLEGGVGLAREAAARQFAQAFQEGVKERGFNQTLGKSKTSAQQKALTSEIETKGRVVWSITFQHR